MVKLSELWRRMMFFLRRGQFHRDLEEEMRLHQDLRAQANVDNGMPPEEAQYAAKREFGNALLLREKSQDIWGWRWLEELFQDLRFGLRQLRRNPGFTAVAVLSLALGIGANVTIFRIVNALLLQPPEGVSAPHRLLAVWNKLPHGEFGYLQQSYPDYVYYRDHNNVFSDLIAFSSDPTNVSWSTAGGAQLILGQMVSANFFTGLGVRPALGRGFLAGEDRVPGKDPVVVLSHSFWQQHLGSDPAVVGKTLTLNGHSFVVVGVAPASFSGVETGLPPEFWVPLMMQREIAPGDDMLSSRHGYWIYAVGRLKADVTSAQALADLKVLAHQLALAHPKSNGGWSAATTPLVGVYDPDFRGFIVPFSALLMVVVGLVLLIACANAANLLLAQASGRIKEMAVRTAVGASRGRLIRQVLTESVLLSLLAGATGLLFAAWAAPLLLRLKPSKLSFINLALPIDWRILVFTLFVSLATGVIFGLAPALRGSKVDVVSRLKDEVMGSTRRSRLLSVLVVGQVVVCMVLLISAGLCWRSLENARSINPGFEIGHRLEVSLNLNTLGYSEKQGQSFYSQLLDRINSLPGVRSASLISYLPLGFTRLVVGIVIDSRQPPPGKSGLTVGLAAVSPRYFETMGIPLLRGREFSPHDTSTAPEIVIINQEMARRYWPGLNPIGRRIRLAKGDHPSFEVVGVVKTGKYHSLRESPQPFMYRPLAQFYSAKATLIVRTAADPKVMIGPVEKKIHSVDSNVPVTDAETLQEYMAVPLFEAHVSGILLGALGLLALLLAMAGLYGVVAYSVSQRTREIGIRTALGAQKRDIFRLVVGQGMILVVVGVGLGIAGALGLTRFLSSLLYGVKPTDPLTFVVVSILLTGVALLACYIPARRAMKIDPMEALRYE